MISNIIKSSNIKGINIGESEISLATPSLVLLFADSFTDANSTLLTSHNADQNSVGTSYGELTGSGYGSAFISGNQLVALGGIKGNNKNLNINTWSMWLRGVSTSNFIQFGKATSALTKKITCSFTNPNGRPSAVLIENAVTKSTTSFGVPYLSTNFDAFIVFNEGTITVYNAARTQVSTFTTADPDAIAGLWYVLTTNFTGCDVNELAVWNCGTIDEVPLVWPL